MKQIQTSGAPAAIGPYSQAISVDGWLYCSGQIPLDPATGKMVDGGTDVQARQVLRNMTAVLEAADLGMADVVRTTIFLVDLGEFGMVNEIYAEAFGDAKPARATVEVSALPMGARVEIDCIARARKD
jgi:2-iminobutanoate/2-iminopropanoate deaminase